MIGGIIFTIITYAVVFIAGWQLGQPEKCPDCGFNCNCPKGFGLNQ